MSGTGWGSSRKCFCILRENQAFLNSSTTEARLWKSFWKVWNPVGECFQILLIIFWKSLRTDLQSKPKFQFFLCYLVIVICSQLILYFRFVTWRCFIIIIIVFDKFVVTLRLLLATCFPSGSDGKLSARNARPGICPGSGRSLEGNSPLQYFCLGNSAVNGGAWVAINRKCAKSDTTGDFTSQWYLRSLTQNILFFCFNMKSRPVFSD